MNALPTAVAARLRDHLDAIAELGPEASPQAFVAHECDHCDDLHAYLEALEQVSLAGDGVLPPLVDCIGTHVAAVTRLSSISRGAFEPSLQRQLDAFEAVFIGLVELDRVPLEAPLAASLNLPTTDRDGVVGLQTPLRMPTPTVHRSPRTSIVVAFAAAVLVGLATWWWLAAGQGSDRDPEVAAPPAADRACDPDALREAVGALERPRSEHPARLVDIPMMEGRDALLAGCAGLPGSLRQPLNALVAVTADERAAILSRLSDELATAYRALRDPVCADPSVFDEIATMPAHKRGPAMLERCKFAERGFGSETTRVMARLSVYGFVLHQFLLDDGVEPGLARAAVLMLASTPLDAASVARLPMSPTAGVWQDSVLVRISEGVVELPGRPKVEWSDGQIPEIPDARAWFADESVDGASVAFQASPSTPASALAKLIVSLGAEAQGGQILVRDAYGLLAAERLRLVPRNTAATHHLGVEAGRFSISKTASDRGVLAEGRLADGFSELARWAGSLNDPAAVQVAIDPRGLTVQNLVDLYLALRGPDCDLDSAMFSEHSLAECDVVSVWVMADGS